VLSLPSEFDIDDTEIAQMIKEADLDGDGTISFEEFILLVFESRQTQQESALMRAFKVFISFSVVNPLFTSQCAH
jgi:hypothetical protein